MMNCRSDLIADGQYMSAWWWGQNNGSLKFSELQLRWENLHKTGPDGNFGRWLAILD